MSRSAYPISLLRHWLTTVLSTAEIRWVAMRSENPRFRNRFAARATAWVESAVPSVRSGAKTSSSSITTAAGRQSRFGASCMALRKFRTKSSASSFSDSKRSTIRLKRCSRNFSARRAAEAGSGGEVATLAGDDEIEASRGA
jgi:hypothetical protein